MEIVWVEEHGIMEGKKTERENVGMMDHGLVEYRVWTSGAGAQELVEEIEGHADRELLWRESNDSGR